MAAEVTMGFELPQQELEWQYEHSDETRVPGLIMACVMTSMASVVIIALRLLSRRLLHGRLHLEASDWLILIAWVFFATLSVSWAVATKYGIGRHIVVVTDIHRVQVLVVVGQTAYILANTFIKFSILALYFKTFPIQKFRYCVWGVAVFVVGWGMSGSVVAIFQCTSIDYVWRPDAREFCINFSLRNLISGTINSVTDILIMVMVIPLIWNKQVLEREKWLVLSTFAAGSSAWIMSIVRLPYSIKAGSHDETWDAAPTVIVSVLEVTIGMLAVSIPTYRPLYKQISGRRMSSDTNSTRACSYKETLHIGLYGKNAHTNVNVTSPGTHMGSDHSGINVTNHIELIRHTNKSGHWVRVTDEDEEELCKAIEGEPRENDTSTSVSS
ncbi:hypothetical protein F5Y12DRAFT_797059 [Xylaria sp. FL1777]|nr:hypothetical protein F5Y12DRAFT_797059 [Xylaria sp. FL1777]